MDVDFSKINSKKAKEQFEARKQMQEDHLEMKYGRVRELEKERAEQFVNFALLNWILTLHDFSHLKGMDLLNEVQKFMMMHLTQFEVKVRKMEQALGPEKMEELEIDPMLLYPSVYAATGLKDVQEEARRRARAGKYLKLEKPKKIEVIK